jgi:hypothetical protein
MTDLNTLAEKEWRELKEKRERMMCEIREMDKKIMGLQVFLHAVGMIQEPDKPKRGRKNKEKKV